MNGVEIYYENQVTTVGKGRIVVLLYEGAVKFLKLAIKEIQAGNWAAKGEYIGKAQDIIFELNTVLDMDAGGEIAKNLRSLYIYMNRRLNQANIKKDAAIIQEVIGLMEELLYAWRQIADTKI